MVRLFLTTLILISLLFLFTEVIAQEPVTDSLLISDTRVLMGTTVEIKVRSTSKSRGQDFLDKAFSEIERIESLLSTYKPDSEISMLIEAAGTEFMPVGPDLWTVLKEAVRMSVLSEGAFDITYKPLWDIWKTYKQGIPSQSRIKEGLALVGFQKILFKDEDQSIMLKEKGMKIDLGGIGKGYAVDRALAVLQEAGCEHALVNAGGDLRVTGKNGDRPWTAGLRHPRVKSDVFASLPVENQAVVTSGDYERYIQINGKKYAHIVDPRSGWPVSDTISVTVLAPSAMTADALSTATFVLGPEKGLALVETIDDVDTIIIDRTGKLFKSSGLSLAGK